MNRFLGDIVRKLNDHASDETTARFLTQAPASPMGLAESSTKNVALCRESTQTNTVAKRSADEIVAEVPVRIVQLDREAYAVGARAKGNAALNGKQ